MGQTRHIWQRRDFPHFRYDRAALQAPLAECRVRLARLLGTTEVMRTEEREELRLGRWTEEARLTSDIEGIRLSREDVRSSLERHLQAGAIGEGGRSREASQVAALMVRVEQDSDPALPVTEEMLLEWHRVLMGDRRDIHVGRWRSSPQPMQIVSGRVIGRESVHYEAPPSAALPELLKAFFRFCNLPAASSPDEAILHSGLVHLYFETLHPLEDGNGRIGRALAQRDLQARMGKHLPLSLSATIDRDRTSYYDRLEEAQGGTMEVTPWLVYWVGLLGEALEMTFAWARFITQKAHFGDRMREASLSDRQTKVLRRMLDEGPEGFRGGMTARKYASLTRSSKATATRDLTALLELGLLRREGEGRSTAYCLRL